MLQNRLKNLFITFLQLVIVTLVVHWMMVYVIQEPIFSVEMNLDVAIVKQTLKVVVVIVVNMVIGTLILKILRDVKVLICKHFHFNFLFVSHIQCGIKN